MRLRKFRIRGFRCIEDSGIVHLAPDITILAGKNESGKSTVLDAFDYFMTKVGPLPFGDRTQGYDGPQLLWTEFELEEADIEHLRDVFGVVPEDPVVVVQYDSDTYYISGRAFDEVHAQLEDQIVALESSLETDLKALVRNAGRGEDKELEEARDDGLRKAAAPENPEGDAPDEEEDAGDDSRYQDTEMVDDDMPSGLADLLERFKSVSQSDSDRKRIQKTLQERARIRKLLEQVEVQFYKRIPELVYFRSVEDELPDYITLGETPQVPAIVQSFCELSGLNMDRLMTSESPQERKYIVQQATNVYSSDFGEFWRQEKLKVGPDIDGRRLVFMVQGDGEPHSYAPSQRSKGLKWYTSFFIALNSRGKSSESALVLIDEPGLYLHAAAQNDLLRLLEDMANSGYQVVIATHSPYLISIDRLDRVRPVYRDPVSKRTSVKNSWYLLQSEGQGDTASIRETLTPLITAMGLDVANAFPGVSQVLNVIVEGPTDYYYLSAMKLVLERMQGPILPEGTALIPCLGHANVGLVLSVLVGWGLTCVVVLDRKGTDDTVQVLKRQGIPESSIIQIGPEKMSSTADLFSAQDIKTHILPKGTIKSGVPASELVKRVPGASETLLARGLYDRVVKGEEPNFTQQTLDQFAKLFRHIADALGSASRGATTARQQTAMQ